MTRPRPGAVALDWLRRHDRNYLALRRAGRAAILMPAALAVAVHVIGNPVLATFTAFGSFAMLLLIDFQGSIRDRMQDQFALGIACCVMITLGTLVSRTTWLAVVVTALVAFLVLFAGVVSSTLAGATTALLLAFVLPVSLPGAVSSIPARLEGWGLAAGVSVIAIGVLWPAPAHDPIRGQLIATCKAIAARLRADVAYIMGRHDEAAQAEHAAAVRAANATFEGLHGAFFATPYRPTGLTTSARALVRLVDELRWLNVVVLKASPRPHAHPNPRVCAVKDAAADTLDAVGALLDAPASAPLSRALSERVTSLNTAVRELEQATTAHLPVLGGATAEMSGEPAHAVISSLDPGFRAQELSFVVSQIALNADYAAAADRRPWRDRVLGRQPDGLPGRLAAASQRAGSHVQRASVSMHNSIRGGVALSMAVLVADLISVQHAFWVIFGTLSVLRSNALSTGQNVVRALIGTAVGFAIGAGIVVAIGSNTTVLWILLPFVVLFAGLAPAAISFTAGQAAFTVTLLILFNLLAPVGWRIGLVRIEDVAIGGAVSLAVGVLFWPRGARAALGRALSEAYRECAAYLSQAVQYGVGRCDAVVGMSAAPAAEAQRAAAASRRLDDTFRGFLSERGSKPVALADVTSLVTGVTGVRLAADAIVALWEDGDQPGGDRAAARRELAAEAAAVSSWYEHIGASLEGVAPVPEPLDADPGAAARLVEAVAHDLRDPAGEATATGVRVIWTGDHLDAVRQLQARLVPPAHAVAAARAAAAAGGVGAAARGVAARGAGSRGAGSREAGSRGAGAPPDGA